MTTQFLSHPEGKIAYEVTGAGPLIVCVPSMGDSRAEYRFLAPQLAEAGYRVAAMDLRGHGESSTDWTDFSVAGIGQDILALIRELDGGPAIVIADSIGAGAAVWAAAEAPDQVRGLVLLGAAVRGDITGAFRALLKILFARPWGPPAWRMYFSTLFPTRKPAGFAGYTAALQRNLSEPGRMEALATMMLASKAASEARLGRVSAPALVLMGTKDPDFKNPEAEAAWVAGKLHATCQMIEGAGHYPQAEMPEIAGPKILEFLGTLQPEASDVAAARS